MQTPGKIFIRIGRGNQTNFINTITLYLFGIACYCTTEMTLQIEVHEHHMGIKYAHLKYISG